MNQEIYLILWLCPMSRNGNCAHYPTDPVYYYVVRTIKAPYNNYCFLSHSHYTHTYINIYSINLIPGWNTYIYNIYRYTTRICRSLLRPTINSREPPPLPRLSEQHLCRPRTQRYRCIPADRDFDLIEAIYKTLTRIVIGAKTGAVGSRVRNCPVNYGLGFKHSWGVRVCGLLVEYGGGEFCILLCIRMKRV